MRFADSRDSHGSPFLSWSVASGKSVNNFSRDACQNALDPHLHCMVCTAESGLVGRSAFRLKLLDRALHTVASNYACSG